MKLAEALQLRADLKTQIAQLDNRLYNNAVVQEGETTNEDPEELLKQLTKNIKELEQLVVRINKTNCQSEVEGQSLMELIARRDSLTSTISSYRKLADAASNNTYRASRTEIKILPTVNVKDIQKKIDSLSKQLRVVNNKIQQANWNIELL